MSLRGPRKETGYLTATGPNREEIRVPVATVHGAGGGPRVLMVAGVHACEYAGIEALRRLFHSIDPAQLKGTLITVPCLNLPAFFGLCPHVNPIDGVNAGRVFPGRPDGSNTERMVHLVWDQLARTADYVFDLHGGDLEEELVEFSLIGLTGHTRVDQEAEALALAMGMPIFVRTPVPSRLPLANTGLRTLAGSHGIPAVLTEVGSHGILDDDEVTRLVDSLRRGLAHLAMLPYAARGARQPLILHRFQGVFAPVEGLWFPAVQKGAAVSAGERLGVMRDIFDNPVTEIVAAEAAVVLVVTTSPPRRAGDILFGLGMAR